MLVSPTSTKGFRDPAGNHKRHSPEKKIIIPEIQNPVSPLHRFKKPDFRFLETRALQSTPNPLLSRNKCTNQDLGPKLTDPYQRKSFKNQNKRKQTKEIQKGPHYAIMEHGLSMECQSFLSKKRMILETNKENTRDARLLGMNERD
jgi:hypothetical protein